MQPLETKLDELLVKKAPFQIPPQGREGLVKVMPWIAVVGGVAILIAVWSLWQLLNYTSQALTVANGLGAYYNVGIVAPAGLLTPLVWVSLIVLAVEAILFFIAYPGLVHRKKSAWNILFYVSLINVVQALVQFIGYTNFGTLLGSLLGSLAGLYVLFQIRSLYAGEPAPAAGGSTPEAPKKDAGDKPTTTSK